MKMTSATTYALRALVHMAHLKAAGPVTSHAIATAEGLPERFLLKALKPLVAAGVLHSVKGPHGGYRLARAAERIGLLDVIEAIDGAVQRVAPEVGENDRGKLDEHLQEACDRTAELVRQRLRKVSLKDLATRKG